MSDDGVSPDNVVITFRDYTMKVRDLDFKGLTSEQLDPRELISFDIAFICSRKIKLCSSDL